MMLYQSYGPTLSRLRKVQLIEQLLAMQAHASAAHASCDVGRSTPGSERPQGEDGRDGHSSAATRTA